LPGGGGPNPASNKAFARRSNRPANIIENDVTTDIAHSFSWRKVLAGFLHNHRQFRFVVQFLRQVFRINHRFVRSDDGVGILKESDPWYDGM
jgi:hypothetical protein